MDSHQAGGAERAPFWPPQDTTGWELVPGPHACWCEMPACRSGWEWRPTAATPEATPGGTGKTLDVKQDAAGRATEPGAQQTGLTGPQRARQNPPGWQASAEDGHLGRGAGAAEMEREA
jgi:hypothetical protein